MYFKTVKDGYIVGVQTRCGQTEITEQEYNLLSEIIHNKPVAESGYDYKFKENLTWERYQIIEQESD